MKKILLENKLQEIDPSLVNNLEEELVILYPPVVKRLKKAGIGPITTVEFRY